MMIWLLNLIQDADVKPIKINNMKNYSVACFVSENYIFVGTLESYILNGKSVDEDNYETLEILEYNPENRFVRFSTENDSLFSLFKGEEVDKKHLISLDQAEGVYTMLGMGDVFFEIKPEMGILMENGFYGGGDFRVCEGREEVCRTFNNVM